MSDMNLRLTEAWFRLLAEAARGTREAQDTVRGVLEGRIGPEKLAQRIASVLPGVKVPRPEALADLVEGFWSAAGVVPRARYMELLERYEALRARLEEAEVTIRKLRKMLDAESEQEARQVLDIWGKAVGDTLRAQAKWMRGWTTPVGREGERKRDPHRPSEDDRDEDG